MSVGGRRSHGGPDVVTIADHGLVAPFSLPEMSRLINHRALANRT
jgi:hypothetical protein